MSWTLVTGGAGRLGSAIAHALANRGKNLIIHYRRSQAAAYALADELRKKGIQVETIQGDFSTVQGLDDFVQRYLSEFSATEGLIYTIGDYLLGSALETSSQKLGELFQPNLFAALDLARALSPALTKQRGQIITIGMVGCDEIRANSHAFAYNLTKVSLWMLTKSLAKELAKEGVRVNMVSPGYMEESIDLPENVNKIPLKRLATHEEVARAVAFLADPGSSYITGQNLEVAGGVRL